MRHILIFLVLSIFSVNAFAQCEQPILESWHFTSPQNVNIAFEAPEGTQSYDLIFTALYTNSGPMPGTAEVNFTGSATGGLNEVSVNPTQIIDFTLNAQRYFYKVSLNTMCEGGAWSDTLDFYVSPYSMRNNPGFECGAISSSPIALLLDTGGDPNVFTFEVDAESAPEVINNLGILVDIGHTFNGDLSMSLISPAGTEVDLINDPNGLGNTSGLSMFFADYGAELNTQHQMGIFMPAEPMSTFNGESPVGTWKLSVIDNLEDNYGVLFGFCLSFDEVPCSATVSGITYYDLDGNGSKGNDEPVFPYAHIHDATTGSDFYSDASGKYFGCLSENNNVLQWLAIPEYYTISPATVSPNLQLGGYIQNLNFGIVPVPDMIDLEVKFWHSDPVLAGQAGKFIVEYKNVGTSCTTGAHFDIVLNPSLTITGINMDDVEISGNVAQFSISESICPLQSHSFEISFTAGNDLSAGDVLLSDVTISGLGWGLTEQSYSNNSATLQSIVSDDADLNFKSVSTDTITSWFVNADESIDYIIRFQNLTEEEIQNLTIVDALDANLDLSTFRIQSTSHPFVITQEGNLFTFDFKDINLAASTDEIESRGHLRYSVQPVASIIDQTVIFNTANLFFDASEIDLNTVTTLFMETTGLDKYEFNASVYPNPASNQIEVLAPANVKIDAIAVYDVSGKRVDTFYPNRYSGFVIDVSAYNSGAYILRFESAKSIAPLLWIKN